MLSNRVLSISSHFEHFGCCPFLVDNNAKQMHTVFKMSKTIYADATVHNMIASGAWSCWSEQLRTAAKQRKIVVTSVTPIADVVNALRTTLK